MEWAILKRMYNVYRYLDSTGSFRSDFLYYWLQTLLKTIRKKPVASTTWTVSWLMFWRDFHTGTRLDTGSRLATGWDKDVQKYINPLRLSHWKQKRTEDKMDELCMAPLIIDGEFLTETKKRWNFGIILQWAGTCSQTTISTAIWDPLTNSTIPLST
jgi:hypothetical protein